METAELLANQPISVRLQRSWQEYQPNLTAKIRNELHAFFLFNLGRMFTVEEVWHGIGKRGSIASLGVSIRDLRRPSVCGLYTLDIDMEKRRVNGILIAHYGLRSI